MISSVVILDRRLIFCCCEDTSFNIKNKKYFLLNIKVFYGYRQIFWEVFLKKEDILNWINKSGLLTMIQHSCILSNLYLSTIYILSYFSINSIHGPSFQKLTPLIERPLSVNVEDLCLFWATAFPLLFLFMTCTWQVSRNDHF